MSHVFANAYPVFGRRWTAEEDAALVASRQAGGMFEDIAVEMKRTRSSVKARFSYLSLTPEEREARRLRAKEIKQPVIRMQIEHEVERPPVVPDEVWEDRNRRISAPRTLTGWLQGDPPPGFSALERRA